MAEMQKYSTAISLQEKFIIPQPLKNRQANHLSPMQRKSIPPTATQLEDLPNIGKSIAADLRGLGILTPQQLAQHDPLKTYLALSGSMGQRHDPCVLYTLLAAKHFLDSGESVPWWKFTEQGKALLAAQAKRK